MFSFLVEKHKSQTESENPELGGIATRENP